MNVVLLPVAFSFLSSVVFFSPPLGANDSSYTTHYGILEEKKSPSFSCKSLSSSPDISRGLAKTVI